jgi:hypothetical protein
MFLAVVELCLAVVAKFYIYINVFLLFSFLLGACLFSSILNHVFFNAAKKRENSGKDEGPTGIGPQYKQGNHVSSILEDVII